MASKFKTLVCGGTFDHFHKGHENFLKYGLSISEKLIIGITSDEYVNKSKIKNQKSKIYENFRTRKKAVENFLKRKSVSKFEFMKIDDMFGATLDQDFEAEAILVSKSTKIGAEKINQERSKRRLSKFQIIVPPQILAEDGKLISSLRIRSGEIDRNGELYVKPIWLKKTFFLPQELRPELKRPFGKLISKFNKDSLHKDRLIFTVGDETTKIFNKLGLKPFISIIDFKVARKRKFFHVSELGFSGEEKIIEIKNPAGAVTPNLFLVLTKILQKVNKNVNFIIQIDGEDDLSVLPLILVAPLYSCIFYGQPYEGIVHIDVNEKIKNKARSIMGKFKTLGY
ncbi:MAG: pantetheine-phosphate adenylyltransferase [Candidatus Pacearchaeota archaeon]